MLNVAMYLFHAHLLSGLPPPTKDVLAEYHLRHFIAGLESGGSRSTQGARTGSNSTSRKADRTGDRGYVSIRVKNLPSSALPADIEVMFSQCGDVAGVELESEPSREAQTAALVAMSACDAQLALKRLHGHRFRNHELTVSLAA